MSYRKSRIPHPLSIAIITGLLISAVNITGLYARDDMSVVEIRENLITQFEKIEDYMVRVKVTVDMPKFRMPSKTIDVAFKQPDKIKIESTGFAIAPKSGMHFSPKDIFSEIQNAEVTDSEYLNGELHWIVTGKINPDSARQEMGAPSMGMDKPMQMLVWVDDDRWVISKTETRAGDKTVMQTLVDYQRFPGSIWLPSRTEVQFTFPEGFMGAMPQEPEEMAEELQSGNPRGNQSSGMAQEPIKGSVIMEFINYKVNSGIKDSFFEDTE
ncbi:MAG: hypothetical protein MAGBODY4_01593 [Candidatus Marinimicrobia bacterium]|nr:hypothetical protein [Candidatus Neomarinimicrobiota bacterium]